MVYNSRVPVAIKQPMKKFFSGVLCHTNSKGLFGNFSNINGGGRPQAYTCIELLTFIKPTWQFHQMWNLSGPKRDLNDKQKNSEEKYLIKMLSEEL